MKRLLLLALPLALVAATPALACSYTQVPEEVGDGSARYFARRMVAVAAYVDLVLLEDDGTQALGASATGVLTVRSIAHLKGDGPDRFSLFGEGLTLSPYAERVFKTPLQHFTGDDGRVTPFPYNEERPGRLFPDLAGAVEAQMTMTSCSPNAIAGQSGRFYVVMRGVDGRLLGDLPGDGRGRETTFAFVPVTLDPDDHWLRAVYMATYDGTAVPGPTVLHLHADADPARAEAALRKAGVTPVAAFVQSGDWIDEIRPANGEARSGWLTRAVPLVAARNKGGLGGADHGAAEFLRGKLRFEQTYGGLGYEVAQGFNASIRRRQAAKKATPRLFAITLSGSADAIAALAREPFADGLRPLARAIFSLTSHQRNLSRASALQIEELLRRRRFPELIRPVAEEVDRVGDHEPGIDGERIGRKQRRNAPASFGADPSVDPGRGGRGRACEIHVFARGAVILACGARERGFQREALLNPKRVGDAQRCAVPAALEAAHEPAQLGVERRPAVGRKAQRPRDHGPRFALGSGDDWAERPGDTDRGDEDVAGFARQRLVQCQPELAIACRDVPRERGVDGSCSRGRLGLDFPDAGLLACGLHPVASAARTKAMVDVPAFMQALPNWR